MRNFRLFSAEDDYEISDFNVPDGNTEGSGINVFVGENGCGKTTILEALAMPILEYKSDAFSLDDMNDPMKPVRILLYANDSFEVQGTMPKSAFKALGFEFKASFRARNSRSYLSTPVVSDQLFIRENPKKPADGSPDLRLSVNNPFSGKRFNENDIVYLDRNRLYQIRSGNFNTTRFDRLMEDFDYQYIKSATGIQDLNAALANEIKKWKIENEHLGEAIKEFQRLTGISVKIGMVDNSHPFKNASFISVKSNNQQIRLGSLGSGYEMIFSLIYSFYLARQSGKQLIILLDEPELHLHPSLQEKLVALLLSMSMSAQIFLSTHSSLLIKQISLCSSAKIMIFKSDCKLVYMEGRKLPYVSSSETNYLAFGLATEEYHNELYEELKYMHGEKSGYKDFDDQFFVKTHGESTGYPWKQQQNQVSVHTFIRNQIHHPKENGIPDRENLRSSIERLRTFFR